MASRKNEIQTNIEANNQGFITAMDEVQKSVSHTRIEFKNINEMMKNSGTTAEELRDHKERLKKEIDNVYSRLVVLQKGLKETSERTGEDSNATRIAREEVEKASTQYYNLKNKLDEVNKYLDNQVTIIGKVSDGFKGISDKFDSFAKNTKWLSVGAGSLLGLGAKTAIEYEDAFVGVAKTVGGTDEELALIRNQIMGLSKEIPVSTTELFNLAQQAGQLGIARKDVVEFTKTMSKLSSATDLTTDAAGSAMATMANVMGTSSKDYERLGSVIVQLGNNTNTTESGIVSMAKRIMGAGKTLGMTESDVLGLSAAISSVGIEAEMGGSAISKLLNDFNKAASGAETKYGSLSQYAKVAGMDAKAFANLIKTNAGEAVKKFLLGLGNTNKASGETIKLLSALGIEEVRMTDTMLRLANSGELVGDCINMANNAWKENNALEEEASKKFQDTASQMAIFKNRIGELADKFGQHLLPTINDLLKSGSRIIDWLGSLDDNTKKNIITGGLFVASLYPISKGISSITGTISKITGAYDKLSKSSTILSTLNKGLSGIFNGVFGSTKQLITNIVNTNSRTIDLTNSVKQNNAIWDIFKKKTEDSKGILDKLKTGFANVGTKIKDTTKNVKDGIDYWYQTTSSVDKLKTGIIGLTGTIMSLNAFNDALKDMATHGANFSNVSTSIASGVGTISSAVMTGASIAGPWGAAIGGIGAGLYTIVSGISAWCQANDEARVNLETTQSNYSNFRMEIDNLKTSFENSTNALKTSSDAKLVEMEHIRNLGIEMSNFIDTNGRVKKGQEDYVGFILTQLNDAYGLQLSLEGNVIKNGKDIITNKDKLIELINKSADATTKEIILQNYQAQYNEAIKAQTEAKRIYNETLREEQRNLENAIKKYEEGSISSDKLNKIYQESSKKMEQAQKDYQGVLGSTEKVIGGLGDVTKIYAKGSAEELQKTIDQITSASKTSISDNEKTLRESYGRIANEMTKVKEEMKKTLQERYEMTFSGDFSPIRKEMNAFIKDYNKTVKDSKTTYMSPLKPISENNQFYCKYAKGGVFDKPTLGIFGEAGREAVVPLENNTGWINEIADKLRNHIFDYQSVAESKLSYSQTNLLEEKLNTTINVLEKILAKSSDIYMDGKKVSEVTASTDDIASGDLLEKLERGWVI